MVGKRGLGQSGNFPQDIHLAAHGKTNLKGRIMKSLLANHSEVHHLPFPNKMTTARQLYLVTPETLNTVTANLSVCTIYRKFQKLFILATFGFSSMEHQPYCSKKKKKHQKTCKCFWCIQCWWNRRENLFSQNVLAIYLSKYLRNSVWTSLSWTL